MSEKKKEVVTQENSLGHIIEGIQEKTLPAYPSPSLLRHTPWSMSKLLGKRYEEVGIVPCKTKTKYLRAAVVRAAVVPPGMDSVGSALSLCLRVK